MDKNFWKENKTVIGTDECGRGCLAGPVVAAAVAFERNKMVDEAGDSKKINCNKRKILCNLIEKKALGYCVASRSCRFIDEHNILNASLDAMKEAVTRLIKENNIANPIVLVDGNRLIPDLEYEQIAVVKGDQKSKTIGCASILAKVYRDDFMVLLDKISGNKYNFSSNKGYPSREHYDMITKYSTSDFHRKSFRLHGGYKKEKKDSMKNK